MRPGRSFDAAAADGSSPSSSAVALLVSLLSGQQEGGRNWWTTGFGKKIRWRGRKRWGGQGHVLRGERGLREEDFIRLILNVFPECL